jgi:hypothetical protein
MDGDEIFYKGGADIFLFGHARAPAGREATRVDVGVTIGGFRRSIAVFGDRVWEGEAKGLRIGAPAPFREIPLAPSRAYGGKDLWDGLEVPFPDNPEGRGFYLEAERAVGRPLPNVERPDRLIREWSDRPDPVGTVPCPLHNGLRVRAGLAMDRDGVPGGLRPTLFNNAYPDMIADRIEPGMRVTVTGMTEDRALEFEVPRLSLVATLRFGDATDRQSLHIDQLGIEVDRNRLFLAYRYPFRYRFRPMEIRTCEVAECP